MPRRPRLLVEGAVYHAYCRFRSSLRVFEETEEAEQFLARLGEVKKRDGFTVLAWCLMPTHYHLLLRMGDVALSRAFRRLHGGFAQGWNRRHQTLGPLWQSRFKARLVAEPSYFTQVVAYIHRNPVVAGLAEDPLEYRWSGHRELLSDLKHPLTDVAETLGLFGERKATARRRYRALMGELCEAEWIGGGPGRLPWWRRSTRGDEGEELPRASGPLVDALGASTVPARPRLGADEYLRAACKHEEVSLDLLASRRRDRRTVATRELIAVVGVERYRIRVGELARLLGKPPDTASRWVSRGADRRANDAEFATRVEALDAALRTHSSRRDV